MTDSLSNLVSKASNLAFKKALPVVAAASSVGTAGAAFQKGNNTELIASSIEASASVGLLTPAALASGIALGGVQMARAINDAACNTGSSICNEDLGPSLVGAFLFDRASKNSVVDGVVNVLASPQELGELTTPSGLPAQLLENAAKIEK